MLLFRGLQRADGWCESAQTKESSLTPESPLRMNLVVEDGRPVIGCGLHASPREIVHCEMAIIKVVPRICLFVLGVLNFKDFFISDESIYFEKERNYTWNKSESVTSL